ncbi:MAG: leucine-rich repeat domain-containing protein [Oscillospiraceae bacterium]|nr:leucine-rich repeat domain-containing protein [Oscillospiraceae bacterium]
MRKVLRVFKCIVLLAYLLFVVLCCHSCMMTLFRNSIVPEGGDAAVLPVSESTPEPVQQPKNENEVALSSGIYQKDAENLTAVITASDLPLLDAFTALRSADFSGSSCYEELVSWAAGHPDVSVRYTVALPDGQTLANDAASVNLSSMDPALLPQAASLLTYLPNLQTVDLGVAQGGSTISSDVLAAISAAAPNAELHYALSLLGREVSLSDTELDLSSMSAEQVSEAASILRSMNNIQLIHLGSQGNGLGWDAIGAIHEAAPKAALDYNFSIYGVDTNLSTDYLSFSHNRLSDQGSEIRSILPYMTRLQTLDMDTCDVSNENMAVIRDENPNVDVIWRIWFAGYSVRTDVERILASSTARGGAVTDEEASKLQYCTKVKYLDLGHNEVLTDISFARSMPELEVLILAINNISDISPLADCHKLEYLEINSTNVTDLTPLANATSLRHLNIGRTIKTDENTGADLNRPRVTDLTPLYGLSGLERLWIGSLTASGIPAEQIAYMKELLHELPPDPNDDFVDNQKVNIIAGDPSQGTWRFDEHVDNSKWDFWLQYGYFNYDYMPRYALLREQFQYDLGDAAYSLPQNDPLY